MAWGFNPRYIGLSVAILVGSGLDIVPAVFVAARFSWSIESYATKTSIMLARTFRRFDSVYAC